MKMKIFIILVSMLIIPCVVVMSQDTKNNAESQMEIDKKKNLRLLDFEHVINKSISIDDHLKNRAAGVADYYDIDLGSEDKKPSEKRVFFTKERIKELFPDSKNISYSLGVEEIDQFHTDSKTGKINAINRDGKILSDNDRNKFPISIRGTFTKDESIDYPSLQVDMQYFSSEKAARLELFKRLCGGAMPTYMVVEVYAPTTELKIGELCFFSPSDALSDKESIRTIVFVRDCTLFAVSPTSRNKAPIFDVAQKIDEAFVKLNTEMKEQSENISENPKNVKTE